MSRRTIFSDEYTKETTVTRYAPPPSLTTTPTLSSFIAIQPVAYVPKTDRVVKVRYDSRPRSITRNEENYTSVVHRSDSSNNLRSSRCNNDYDYNIKTEVRTQSPVAILRQPRSMSRNEDNYVSVVTRTDSSNNLNNNCNKDYDYKFKTEVRTQSPVSILRRPRSISRNEDNYVSVVHRSDSSNNLRSSRCNNDYDYNIKTEVRTESPVAFPRQQRSMSRNEDNYVSVVHRTDSSNNLNNSCNNDYDYKFKTEVRTQSPVSILRQPRSISRNEDNYVSVVHRNDSSSNLRSSRCNNDYDYNIKTEVRTQSPVAFPRQPRSTSRNDGNYVSVVTRTDSSNNLNNNCNKDYDYKFKTEVRTQSPVSILRRPRSRSITSRVSTSSNRDNDYDYSFNEITTKTETRDPTPPPPPPPPPPQRSRSITRYSRSDSRSDGYKYDYSFDETVEKTVTVAPPPPPPPPPPPQRERSRSSTRITTTHSNDGRNYSYNVNDVTIENCAREPSPPRRSRSITRFDTTTTTTTRTTTPEPPARMVTRSISKPRLSSITYSYDDNNNNNCSNFKSSNNSISTTVVHNDNDCGRSLARSSTSSSSLPVNRSIHVGSVFNGDNFALLSEHIQIRDEFDCAFKFRTAQRNGILMIVVDSQTNDSFFVELVDSQLKATLFIDGEADSCWTEFETPLLSNYVWVDVNISIVGNRLSMTVKNKYLTKHHRTYLKYPIRGDLFVAGHPSTMLPPFVCRSRNFFIGEMKEFFLNNNGIKWYGTPDEVCPRLRNWF